MAFGRCTSRRIGMRALLTQSSIDGSCQPQVYHSGHAHSVRQSNEKVLAR
jgi:hypothetical protein